MRTVNENKDTTKRTTYQGKVMRIGGGCENGGGSFAGWQGLTTSIALAELFTPQ